MIGVVIEQYFSYPCVVSGGLHAVSCKRSVHHGGPCVQFPLHYGWPWVRHS